jgi:hypothetical protein
MPLTGDPWLPYNEDGTVPAARPAAPVGVFRFDGGSGFAALPNVECIGCEDAEGTDPGSAQFRYNLASGLSGAPISIEQALGTGFFGSLVIESGDRLVVIGQRPDGSIEFLFDGLAITFGMGLDPSTEEVHIGALGIGWRSFDAPIPGAILRNSGIVSATQSITAIPTDLPAQFNPGGLPNCTPDGYMNGFTTNGEDQRYPIFLDPLVIAQGGDQRTYWTLAKALRYLLFTMNPDQTYVNNPDGGYLDGLLVSPSASGDTTMPIRCPDTPITGKDWPGTVNRLISNSGFGTNFQLTTVGGLPVTNWNVFANQSGTVKQLYLSGRGTPFDARLFNLQSSNIHRDLADVVNQVTVVGGLDRWEASFVLAPGFEMSAVDGLVANIPTFNRGNSTLETDYRLYVLDECGEGHYKIGDTTQVNTPAKLDDLFGAPVAGVPQYAQRRRPGIGKLITVDPTTNMPYGAKLAISADYDTGQTKGPGLWDGTGTWQVITSTTWQMLDDRLGIEITDHNPNSWEIGTGTPAEFASIFYYGVVRGIEKQCAFVSGSSFWLRLTCVVESDQALSQTAVPTGNSPLPQPIERTVDASDRYHNEFVDFPSQFNSTGSSDLNPRNNNAAALAEAQAMRLNQESGVLSGPVTIPRLTTYYQVGDRISAIEGRNLGLRTDQGTGNPIYPVVVGRRFEFGPDGQYTILELSDAGTRRSMAKRPATRRPRPAYIHKVRPRAGEDTGTTRGAGPTGYEAGYMAPKPQNAGGYVPSPGEISPWG